MPANVVSRRKSNSNELPHRKAPDLPGLFAFSSVNRSPVACVNRFVTLLLRHTRFWWMVVIPWVALYYAAASFGVPRDAFHPGLWFEPLPVLPWTSILYFSEYPAVVAVPFLLKTPERYRTLMIHCWIAIVISFLFYFTLPSIAPRPPVPLDAFLGPFLNWERGNYPASVAFPSFHVIWAILIAYAMSDSTRSRFWWWTWAVGVCLSCVTTGMHWIPDILAGALVCCIAIRYETVWVWIDRRVPQARWNLAALALAMLLRRFWYLDAPVSAYVCAILATLTLAKTAQFLSRTRHAQMLAKML